MPEQAAAPAGIEWLITTDADGVIETFFGTSAQVDTRTSALARERNERVWMQPASEEWPPVDLPEEPLHVYPEGRR